MSLMRVIMNLIINLINNFDNDESSESCKMDRSGPLWIPTPWAKCPSPNLVDRSSPPYTRFNKILINTFKIN